MTGVEVVRALTPKEIESAAPRAAEVLRAGGLIVHPTETVYGIGGDGSAVNNALIARVKRRGEMQPLILLAVAVPGLSTLVDGLVLSPEAEVLARHFWPGPLTLILGCAAAPDGLRSQEGGVAVRITPHPVVRAILNEWRAPMTSTSANLAGADSPRTVDEALELFEDREDLGDVSAPVLAVDAGETGAVAPSTIVSCMDSPPRVLREGPISTEQIAKVLETIGKAR